VTVDEIIRRVDGKYEKEMDYSFYFDGGICAARFISKCGRAG
jgi:hypothetical protein